MNSTCRRVALVMLAALVLWPAAPVLARPPEDPTTRAVTAPPAPAEAPDLAEPEPEAVMDLAEDDLAKFGLPLLITFAFLVFLVVEARFGSGPSKLAEADLTARRPLRFR